MELLGKGAYGQVVKINDTAVKQYQRLPALIQEYTALMYLKDCKYIVKALNVDYHKLTLTMELYTLNMREYMTNECLCEKCVFRLTYCILRGLIELQDRSCSHSDLKPSNILINIEPWKLVLGDCGFISLANYSKQQRTAHSYRDIVVKNDDKHDMFSLGVILLELLYKVRPKPRNSYKEFREIISDKVTNDEHKDLLYKLFDRNRSNRPNAREVIFLLFNKTPPEYIPLARSHYQEIADKISTLYPKAMISDFGKILNNCWKNLGLNRSCRGLKGLFIYLLDKKGKAYTDSMLYCYLAATCIILSSTFGNHQPYIGDIIEACNVSKKSDKSKVMKCIEDLTNHEGFICAIFS